VRDSQHPGPVAGPKAGLPDFSLNNITKRWVDIHTKYPLNYQMTMNYNNIFHFRALKNLPE
jgi:hypothetical protein